MGASIDERVVAMSFENAKFEAGVAQTLKTLEKLNQTLANVGATSGLDKIEAQANKVTLQQPMSALDKLKAKFSRGGDTKVFADIESASQKVSLTGPLTALDKLRQKLGFVGDTKGFSDIEKASNQVTLSGMGSAIDAIKVKFGALQTVGIAALGTVTAKATAAGGGLVKDISLGPLTGGLQEYATNLNSIQTILANTKASGAGLDDVNRALQDLNHYSDLTIYNFSQMAKNIGTFTAAGVDLETATASIKGIANLAALSGSNSEQASTAMYQLSQAISAGRVSLQDWNSVVNAGMGGTVFQRALAQTAVAMGKIDENSVKLKGSMKNVTVNGESFRNSIMAAPGKESWLTSDVLTNTLQQFTGDLSAAQLQAQGFNAEQIKAIQSTAKTAKNAATEVKTLSGVWDVAKEAMGSGWAQTWQAIFGDFGEAKTLFTGVSNALNGFIGNSANARNKVLKDWKDLGGRTLLIDSLKTAFKALGDILSTVGDAFRDIFPRKTGKDLFALTQAFHNFAQSLKSSPETLENLRRTFRGLFAILDIGWTIIKKTVGVIFDLLGVAKDGAGGFLSFTGGIGDFLTALDEAISKGHALDGFFSGLTAVLRVPLEIIKALASAFFGLFDGMDASKAEGANKALDGVSTSLRPMKRILDGVVEAWRQFVGFIRNIQLPPFLQDMVDRLKNLGHTLADAIKNADFNAVFAAIQTTLIGGIFLALKKALGGGVDVTGGLLTNLNDSFKALTGNLTAMQKNIQAGTLLKIASAIAVLAGGVALLSTIDPKALTRAMTAVAVGLGQLVAALAILSKVTSGASFLTMPLIAASLIELAAAVTLLAGAMKIFATMSWEDLAKGLTGLGGALVAVGFGLKLIGPSIIGVAPGLIAVGLAMNILAVAMKILAGFSWEELAKGVVGIAGSLVALGIGLTTIGPSITLVGPGLIAAAIGLTLLSGAVRSFGGMKLEDLVKGIVGIGAALLTIGIAISAIPPTVALQAAGLVILGLALTGIAGAVKLMGGMDIGTMVKGIVGLGGALVVLALGLDLMAGSLPGSLALMASAAALAVLAPTLGFLGTLEWGTIFKGLAAIAGVLLTLSVVGTVASGGLVALGAALAVMSVSVIATGAGLFLMAKAFKMLGESGTKGVAVMVAAVTAFLALLPTMIINFVKGLVEIIASVAKLLPQVVDSIIKIVDAIIEVVIKSAPRLAIAIGALIMSFLKVVNDNAGPIIASGFKLLQNFLSGLANNVGSVTTQAATIINRFLIALSSRAGDLVAAGIRLIVAFLNGVASRIGSVVGAVTNMMVRFVGAIGSFVGRMVAAGVNLILNFLRGVANQIPKVVNTAVSVAGKFVRSVARGLVRLANVGADAIIDFLNGIARTIREKGPELRRAGWNLAKAIVEGFWDGFAEIKDKLADKLNIFPGDGGFKKKLEEIKRTAAAQKGVQVPVRPKVVEDPGKAIVDNMGPGLQRLPKMLGDISDIQPTITPVVDLSNVERGVKKISTLIPERPIVAKASLGQASAISNERAATEEAQADSTTGGKPTLKFEQNNYSPEALSDIEIYRRTKNALAQAKNELGFYGGVFSVG